MRVAFGEEGMVVVVVGDEEATTRRGGLREEEGERTEMWVIPKLNCLPFVAWR
jgi:hypothetical protein